VLHSSFYIQLIQLSSLNNMDINSAVNNPFNVDYEQETVNIKQRRKVASKLICLTQKKVAIEYKNQRCSRKEKKIGRMLLLHRTRLMIHTMFDSEANKFRMIMGTTPVSVKIGPMQTHNVKRCCDRDLRIAPDKPRRLRTARRISFDNGGDKTTPLQAQSLHTKLQRLPCNCNQEIGRILVLPHSTKRSKKRQFSGPSSPRKKVRRNPWPLTSWFKVCYIIYLLNIWLKSSL